MVKFCVSMIEMPPNRRKVTREMLAQAFGDNYDGYTIVDKGLFENSTYAKKFLDQVKPDVDLIILDGELKDLDMYHPYEFTSNFAACGVWGFWGSSKRMCDFEAMLKGSKLIQDINKLSKFNAKEDNHYPITKDINFIF